MHHHKTIQYNILFLFVFIVFFFQMPVPGVEKVPEAVAVADTGGFRVLCYHDIRDVVHEHYDPDEYALSTKHLIEHFAWLRDHGYHPISIDDLLQAQKGIKKLPGNAIILTFDDGLKSTYTRIFPVLKLFNYPAVVALVGSWLEGDKSLEIKYANRMLHADDFLTHQQIREIDRSGLIEFASHSYNLHRGVLGNPQGNMQPAPRALEYFPDTGTYESYIDYKNRISRDLERSVNLMKRILGKNPRVMVWPYGKYNRTAMEIAASMGMAINMILQPKLNYIKDLSLIGRNLIVHNPNVEDLLWLLSHPFEDSDPRRVVLVNMDDLYHNNREKMLKNFDALVERVYRMGINTVYLQAFSDSDGDGTAEALYFPNSHLPVRADLFNRVAWQLKNRCGVAVFAWLPVSAFDITKYREMKLNVVMEVSGNKPQVSSYRRLSLFDPLAREVILEIYRDLGRYADFDGLFFHDDAFFNDREDASPAALWYYKEKWGLPADVGAIRADPAVYCTWTAQKTDFLIDFTRRLRMHTEQHCAPLQMARSIYAPAIMQPGDQNRYAQSYPLYLENYNITVVSMPYSKQQGLSAKWLKNLLRQAKAEKPTLKKTLFLLENKNWHNREPLSTSKLLKQMERLLLNGALNYGYSPDDFVNGNPGLAEIRKGMSIRTYPYWKKQ
jgi:biofilm PGA synthesis lipoprotein PgaB